MPVSHRETVFAVTLMAFAKSAWENHVPLLHRLNLQLRMFSPTILDTGFIYRATNLSEFSSLDSFVAGPSLALVSESGSERSSVCTGKALCKINLSCRSLPKLDLPALRAFPALVFVDSDWLSLWSCNRSVRNSLNAKSGTFEIPAFYRFPNRPLMCENSTHACSFFDSRNRLPIQPGLGSRLRFGAACVEVNLRT
jgi:hypothetical protein